MPIHIRQLANSYKDNVITATSPDPILNYFVHLSNLDALKTKDTEVIGSRKPLKDHQRVFVLQMKLEVKLSLETLNIHLLLSKEKAEGRK